MSDNDNRNGGLVAFFQQVWAGVVGVFSVVSAILGYIKLADGNSGLFTLVLLGVGVAGLFLSCFYYAFVWKPEVNDGKPVESVIITPGSNKPVVSQEKKEKRRKRVRWIARLGLLLIPVLVWGGFKYYQYQAGLPPKDFKILVANFESSESEDYSATQEIFSELEWEMEQYGDDVKVERLDKSLGSIKAAKEAGKQKKAAIIIWGNYPKKNWGDDLEKKLNVRIKINFQILKKSADFPKLHQSVQVTNQILQITELESFNLQADLSKDMTYLSLFTLGMYRYLENDWQQGIEYYEQALKVLQERKEPIASLGKEVVYFYLGNSSYSLELYDEAIKSYNQAIEIKPDNHNAWNNRGSALDNLGRHEEAISDLDKAIEINPDLVEAWNNRGLALANLGRHEEAIADLDKAIKINPDKDESWNSRGKVLVDLSRNQEAIVSFDKAIKINPNFDLAWSNRGFALNNLGRHEEAIADLDKAIAINPNLDEAWNNRGLTLDNLGRFDEAIFSFDKAIEINPNLDVAWSNRGVVLGKLGRLEEAISSFDKAIEINPDLDLAWNNYSNTLANLGRHEEAISSFDRSIEIDPDNYNAWYNRGNTLYNLGRFDEAIADYDKAIEINPNLDLAWNNRGVALADLGRYEEAIADYDKAIEINPDLGEAWYGKAASYALQNDIDSALKNLEKAFSLNSELREYAKTDPDFDAIRGDQRFKDLIDDK